MSALWTTLERYLALRRALGFKLERDGMLLPDFLAFLEQHGSRHITTKLALEWAKQPADASAYWWAKRLGFVRRFALHVRAIDPKTEVPPADLIAYRTCRVTPYLYKEAEIRALLQACVRLCGPLSPATYATLLGLLATTGMRLGEAIALDRSDFHERDRLLVIRHGKFDKAREVPLHTTTVQALRAYGQQRDQLWRRPRTLSLLVSNPGHRLWHQNVWERFDRLRRWAALPQHPRPPRIHDLRHSFAVATLLRWYREGVDVEARLPVLSTYLGHVNPSTTYWYLTAAPELLALAAQRLEHAWGTAP